MAMGIPCGNALKTGDITSGSRGGGTPGARPQYLSRTYDFLCPKAKFSHFCSLDLLATHFKLYFNRNIPKTC